MLSYFWWPTIVKQNLFLSCVTINFSKTAPCIDFQNDEEEATVNILVHGTAIVKKKLQ